MSLAKDVNTNNEKAPNGNNDEKHSEKEFVPRNSLLTDLFQNEHINVIHRTFLVAFFLLYVRFVFSEFASGNTVTFGTKYLIKGFGNFDKLIVFWILMFGQTLLVYPTFHLWSQGLEHLAARKNSLKIWNTLGFLLIIVHLCLLVYVPIRFEAFTVSMATNTAIVAEQIRLIMKAHAFLRHNCPRILAFKPHSDKELDRPRFSSYLYYLFAPTLIYRDEYPRTKTTDWSRAFLLFLECVCCLLWESFLLDFLFTRHEDLGLVKETYSSLISSVLNDMLVAPLWVIGVIYFILHLWLNLWSELLRFADRQFYYDWWNSQSPSTFSRKWNLVIYNYLHTYIYKDLLHFTRSKVVASQLTFYLSILAHEYIFAFTVGFFMPIMGAFYLWPAFTLRTGNMKYYNYSLISGMSVVNAIILGYYFMEYHARINCPVEDQSYWRYLGIRLLTCNGLNL